MESYDKIMNLVEEVRGLLNLDEKLHHMTQKKIMKKHASSTKHNPFKNLKKGKSLGPTSKAVAKIKGPRKHGKAGVWRCRCQSYECVCTGKTAEGKSVTKHVRIGRGYKKGYNARYRVWRAKNKTRFAPGGKGGFRAPAKKHHKRYHAD